MSAGVEVGTFDRPLPAPPAAATPPLLDGARHRSSAGGRGEPTVYAARSSLGEESVVAASEAPPRDDGMRREWNFTLTLRHAAARLSLHCAPQWELTFIDPETIERGQEYDRDAKRAPLLPLLRYTDLSAVVVSGGAGDRRTSLSSGNVGHLHGSVSEVERTSGSIGVSEEAEWWVEMSKHVEVWYAHVNPSTTNLASFCSACVKHVLRDPFVVSIDGDTNLSRLRLGDKLACPSRLAGQYRSFHYRFRVRDRSQLTEDVGYAIGAVAHQRGYLFLVRCQDEGELEGYLRRLFLPYVTSPSKLALDTEVIYRPVSSSILAEQQALYGEVLYEDRDASIAFSIPAHPMHFRPDFSPAKTVGVGSIACMTIELGVFERVLEDAAVAEVTGMPKYKINQVVLCLDVEDVARMGYPRVLSTDQYSELKVRRLLEVFPDASLVGKQPTTVSLGGRLGRCYTVTLSYEPMQCVAKAMLVTTLIDTYGITALYLTRLGGGIFDAYLYLYEQLIDGVQYLPRSSVRHELLWLSRQSAPNVRLLEADLAFAYADTTGSSALAAAAAPPSVQAADAPAEPADEDEDSSAAAAATATAAVAVAAAAAPSPPPPPFSAVPNAAALMAANKTLARHLRLMRTSANDGRVPDGAIVLPVPPEGGGLTASPRPFSAAPTTTTIGSTPRPPARLPFGSLASDTGEAAAAASTLSPGAAQRRSTAESRSLRDTREALAGVGSSVASLESRSPSTVAGRGHAEASPGDASLHSQSLISVGSNERLRALEPAEAEEAAGPVTTQRRRSQGSISTTPRSRAGSIGESPSPMRQPDSVAPTDAPFNDPGDSDSVGGRVEDAEDTQAGLTARAAGGSASGVFNEAFENSVGTISRASGVNAEERPATASAGGRAALSQTAPGQAADTDSSSDVTEVAVEARPQYIVGPSLRDVYTRCCDLQHCRPNSHLLRRLPADPQFTRNVEEVDLRANYLGRNGFVAVLNLLEHLPNLRSVFFNDMALDNVDAENLCEALSRHPTVQTVEVRGNTKITLPATRYFTRMLRSNPNITRLALEGTRMGESVIAKLEREAARGGDRADVPALPPPPANASPSDSLSHDKVGEANESLPVIVADEGDNEKDRRDDVAADTHNSDTDAPPAA